MTPKDKQIAEETKEMPRLDPGFGTGFGTETALAVPDRAPLAEQDLAMPSTFDDVPEGFENFTPAAMANAMPRLGLCQSNSHQKTEGDPLFIGGLKEGDFFNTVTGTNYGRRIVIIPAHYFDTRILWPPKEQGLTGTILCRSFDGITGRGSFEYEHDGVKETLEGGKCATCPMSRGWGSDGKPPRCTKIMNFAELVVSEDPKTKQVREPGLEDMLVMALKSTGIKIGEQWMYRARLIKDAKTGKPLPLFGGIHVVEAVPAKSKRNEPYWAYKITAAGQTSEAQRNVARGVYQLMKSIIASRDEAIFEGLDARDPGEEEIA